ncbi:hypothetical protein HMPREF9413_1818 [Paenibacillus sp. HGF7]|nr:hypothetical protein HMPREF9413_1818 [Paenibacillus sp. HGF7]
MGATVTSEEIKQSDKRQPAGSRGKWKGAANLAALKSRTLIIMVSKGSIPV